MPAWTSSFFLIEIVSDLHIIWWGCLWFSCAFSWREGTELVNCYFERSVLIVIEDLILWCLNTLSYFYEKLIYIVFEEFSCLLVQWVSHLVLFYVQKYQSYVLNYCKYQVLTTIIPIFAHLLSKIYLTWLWIYHRMVDLTHKHYFRGFLRKLFKCDLELKFGIFVKSIAYKEDSMPYFESV